MADPRVASSANAFRDWVNRRKTTLDKLTVLANTRPSQMLCDNIKETIVKLKQEGGLDAPTRSASSPRPTGESTPNGKSELKNWSKFSPTPWNPRPPPSPSSTPPSVLALRRRPQGHQRPLRPLP